MIRVLLADDQTRMRQGIKTLLGISGAGFFAEGRLPGTTRERGAHGGLGLI